MSNIVFADRSDILSVLGKSAMAVTDENVFALYGKLCSCAYVIPAGEKSKSPQTLFDIIEELSNRGVKRGDTVVAFGGGVVSDVAGLAAALYMRGINYINIPTTLLGMVDAAIGGKTAVNHCGRKNIAGAFHEPTAVYIDLGFLQTLPKRELLCGVGEIVKTCVLTKRSYAMLCERLDGLLNFSEEALRELVCECVNIKNTVTSRDFRESGLRKILNVGHTVGHALESANGFSASHGEYVLVGMLTECAMCREIVDGKFYGEFTAMLKRFVRPPKTSANNVLKYAAGDKKNSDGEISIMVATAPGEVADVRLTPDEFVSRYEAAVKLLKV